MSKRKTTPLTLLYGTSYWATPAPGLVIPNPQRANAPLPAEGQAVTWTTYWHHLLVDGDVTVHHLPPDPPPAA